MHLANLLLSYAKHVRVQSSKAQSLWPDVFVWPDFNSTISKKDMSVPKRNRAEHQFTVFDTAYKLAKTLILISKNERVLPKRHSRTLADPLIAAALKYVQHCYIANEYRLDSRSTYQLRLQQQNLAFAELIKIQVTLQFIQMVSNAAPHALSSAEALLQDSKRQLKGWMQSDRKRLALAAADDKLQLASPSIDASIPQTEASSPL